MRRIALCVLLSFLGCDSGPIDIEERPIVEDKAPFGVFDDNGEQVSQNVRLSGVIEDDQVLMFLHCRLTSDMAGVLWEGNPNPDGSWEWEGELAPGTHLVRLEVEDASGNLHVEEKEIKVRFNEAPNCEILSPRPGEYSQYEAVDFLARAEDPDGDEIMRFWSSDQEGTLFEGDSWSQRLKNPGDHLILFEVVDSFGAVCTDEVLITLY